MGAIADGHTPFTSEVDLSLDLRIYEYSMARTENVKQLVNFIWSVADLLRDDYKQADYGKVILPLTVLRRLDCVLEPKETVMDFYTAFL
jgi:hypothetical protein